MNAARTAHRLRLAQLAFAIGVLAAPIAAAQGDARLEITVTDEQSGAGVKSEILIVPRGGTPESLGGTDDDGMLRIRSSRCNSDSHVFARPEDRLYYPSRRLPCPEDSARLVLKVNSRDAETVYAGRRSGSATSAPRQVPGGARTTTERLPAEGLPPQPLLRGQQRSMDHVRHALIAYRLDGEVDVLQSEAVGGDLLQRKVL